MAGKPRKTATKTGKRGQRGRRKRAEQALAESEARFRSVFDHAALGIGLSDKNRRYVDVNNALASMLGYSPAEMIGRDVTQFLHPEDVEIGREERRRLWRGEISGFTYERRYLHKDGRIIWAKRTTSAVRDAAGRPSLLIGVSEDITERKRVEEAVGHERALLRTIIDAVPDYVYVKDTEGRFWLANKAWLKERNLADEDIAGRTVFDIFPDELAQRMAAQDAEIVRTGVPIQDLEQKVILKTPEGANVEARWFSITKVPMKDASGRIIGTVGTSREITERKLSAQRSEMEHAVTRVLAVAGSVEEAMPILIQTMCGAMGWSYGTHWNWSETEQTLVRSEFWSDFVMEFDGEDASRWVRLGSRNPGGLVSRAWFEKRPTWIEDMRRNKSFNRRHSALKFGLHSAFSFPVIAGNDTIGIMEFFGREARRPDEFLLQAAGSIGRQIGQFIQRKRAEEALRASEETLRATFENAPVGIMHTDVEHDRILRANPKLCEMLGYPRHELLGMVTDDLIPPEYRGKERGKYREQMLNGELDVFSSERKLLRKDGSWIWVSRTVSLVKDASGRPDYFIRIIEDVTERILSAQRRTMEHAVTQVLASSATVDEAMPQLLHIICKAMDGAYGARWICDARAGMYRAEFWSDFEPEFDPSDRELWLKQGLDGSRVLLRRAWEQNEPTWIADLTRHESFRRRPSTLKFKLRSAFAFPIVTGGSVVGIMEFFSRDAREPDPMLLQVARSIGSQIGQFIQRKQAEQALRRSEERYRDVFEASPLPMWVWDDGALMFLAVNEAAVNHYGYTRDEFLRMNVRDIWAPGEQARYEESLTDRSRQHTLHLQRRHRTKDGRIIDVEVTARLFTQGGCPVWLTLINDVTERKLAEERLLQLAHYDNLTGLPNRALYIDRMKQAMVRARRRDELVAILFVDLDRFKLANDTFGHAVGDQLLKLVTERLITCVRASDTVGRLGGDEFGLVLADLRDMEDARLVAQKVLTVLDEPFELEGRELFVTASIGISLCPTDSDDEAELMKNADVAMYRAKESGRNKYEFYSREMNARSLQRLDLESKMRRALERSEFLLHYQPKVSLSTGEITGFEALLRWQQGQMGLVSPGEFVPVLEDTGLIVPVGEWVINAVCRQQADWRKAGVRLAPVAINLSARQFKERDFGGVIEGILRAHGIDHRYIEFELTESSLMGNTEEVMRTLRHLKGLGLRLSIDDFGTGYSSLGYLRRFPLDTLKIDRSFVNDITTSAGGANIMRAVISMAHNLGLNVVAEGVESEAQLAFLCVNGCDEMQGYYFSRPLSVADSLRWLRENRTMHRPVTAVPAAQA